MKIDRLIGILTLLLQNGKTTAPALAGRFEVSRRTIMRDIDALCRAGIPVVTTQGGSGGISIMEGYKINQSVLTTQELSLLMAALKGLDSISQKSSFENLMMKLNPENNAVVSLRDNIVIDLSSYHHDSLSEKITLLKNAVAEKRVVTFDYYYSKGDMQRCIEPYFIEFRWNAWYVFGWCRMREDFRRFKLDRLWYPQLSGEVFPLRPIPPDQSIAENVHPDAFTVKILFDKSIRFRLVEDYGLHCYTENRDGLLFEFGFTNKDYLFSWVRGYGSTAEILEPKELREEFLLEAENIVRRYART